MRPDAAAAPRAAQPAHGPPLDGPQLARELRTALDGLLEVGEDAGPAGPGQGNAGGAGEAIAEEDAWTTTSAGN